MPDVTHVQDMADIRGGAEAEEQPKRFTLDQIPGLRQGLLLVGIAAAIAIGFAIVLWSRAPDYSLLFRKLPGKDTVAVVNALQTVGIKYKLNNATGAIMVPSSSLADARLKLAAQGLPQSGNVGKDMVANQRKFGASNLEEKKHYQKLLETDLERTIAHLKPVRAAQVHLALPKQSVFIRRRKNATASVLVDLYPGNDLNRSQVSSIVHLVASSVPELDTKHVSVVDQQGNLLTSKSRSQFAATNRQYQLRHRIEQKYATRIRRILTPLVGPGHVHTQVVVNMDFTRKESVSDHYDPEVVLRSEQTSRDVRRGAKQPIGIPGALSNRPPQAPANNATQANGAAENQQGAAAANGDDQPSEVSTKATRNYEVSHTISHVKAPTGEVARLSAAVVIDNIPTIGPNGDETAPQPVPQETLAKYTELVKGAIGFDATRGDTVSVVNTAFVGTQEMQRTQPPWWKQTVIRSYVKQGLGVLIALALIFFVLRPLFRNLVRPPGSDAPQLEGPDDIGELTADDLIDDEELEDDEVDLGDETDDGEKSPEQLAYEQKITIAKRLAQEDPGRVARVVAEWVGDDA